MCKLAGAAIDPKPEIIDEMTMASEKAANDVGQGEFAGGFLVLDRRLRLSVSSDAVSLNMFAFPKLILTLVKLGCFLIPRAASQVSVLRGVQTSRRRLYQTGSLRA